MASRRLIQIDFLRGIAILLVLLAHSSITIYTTNIGPIGVDLFFVLSGFLVSGLLFKEYIKFGNIKPGLFLIRRGFKIYPLFWLALIVFWLIRILNNLPVSYPRLFAEFVFMQNYVSGWGYALNGVSWSLAIEEHFYIGLALLLPLLIRKNWLKNSGMSKLEKGIYITMVLCLIMRILSVIYIPYRNRTYTMTHLRIDSLLAGVLIAYWYYFRKEKLEEYFTKYKSWILPVAFLSLAYSPFVDPINSHFTRTIGFTLLFTGFGLILIYFIMDKNIDEKLGKYFSKRITNIVARIGYYSYSIYLVHVFINEIFIHRIENPYLSFIVCNSISIISGTLISKYIEYYLLRIRDEKFPSRM